MESTPQPPYHDRCTWPPRHPPRPPAAPPSAPPRRSARAPPNPACRGGKQRPASFLGQERPSGLKSLRQFELACSRGRSRLLCTLFCFLHVIPPVLNAGCHKHSRHALVAKSAMPQSLAETSAMLPVRVGGDWPLGRPWASAHTASLDPTRPVRKLRPVAIWLARAGKAGVGAGIEFDVRKSLTRQDPWAPAKI
jgi:hypothetical protein